MVSVSDPGHHARIDIAKPDGSYPPLVAKAAQPITEAPHVVLWEATTTVGVQLEAEEL